MVRKQQIGSGWALAGIALLLASAATPAQPHGTLGHVRFSIKVNDDRPTSPTFQFPDGTREIFAVFTYSGIPRNARWSWRLSCEGSIVDESYDRIWREKANGTYVLPLTLSGNAGIYDLDLYLGDEVARLSSFIIGSPTTPAQRLLQADDFDRYRDKWGAVGRVEGGSGEFKIDNGRAVMTLTGSTGQVLKRSGKLFTHAIIEADAAPLKDSETAGFGVAFRCKDDRNFNAFVINPKGQFAFFTLEGGKFAWKRNWTTEAPGVIRKGAATNRLRVLDDGSLARVYVNGHFLGALNQVYRDEGQAGILVLGQGKPRGQVAFAKWRAWSLAERYDLAPEKAPWARFAFALPGKTTLAESLQRLGEPYLNYQTSVVEDEISAMEEPSVLDLGVYDRAKARGVKVSEVRVLLWTIDRGPPIATFVFRGNKLWYAKYPSSPTETTPEQLASRYGKDAKTTTLQGGHGDVYRVLKLYSYPAQGLSFTQEPGRQIENKLVFPPSAELPFGLR